MSELPHSQNRGRNDAAWANVASGGAPSMAKGRSTGDATRHALRAELDTQQLRTFQRWWNSWLSEVKLKINDLCEDIKPGIYPIKLLEVLSDSSCGKVCQRFFFSATKIKRFQ